MPNTIRDIQKTDKDSFPYIFEQDVSVPLKTTGKDGEKKAVIRCNVYRPKDESKKYPVLCTYGPYGKDIPYEKYIYLLLFSV